MPNDHTNYLILNLKKSVGTTIAKTLTPGNYPEYTHKDQLKKKLFQIAFTGNRTRDLLI